MRNNSMIPLPVYKTTAGLLQKKSQWRLIDPGVLSPWNVMSWGARQLKGFVVGSESDSAPKLQVQELVLVENLQEVADLAVKKATGGNSSKLDLIYSRESFVEEFAAILNDATELSDADFDVLLLYLSRDSSAIAYDGKVSWTIYIWPEYPDIDRLMARQSSSNRQMNRRRSPNRTQQLHPSRRCYRPCQNRSRPWKQRSPS